MLLTAQRVRVSGVHGHTTAINAYRYAQPPHLDTLPPIQRLDEPSTLVWRQEQVSPPGNRIVSYVDVSLPSDVALNELEAAVALLLQERAEPPDSPFAPPGSRVAFAFDLDNTLRVRGRWRRELATLLKVALSNG